VTILEFYGLRLTLFVAAWVGVFACPALALDETLVATGAACRYLVPANGALGTNWTARMFDDSAWTQGTSGLGYDTDSTYASLFGTTVPNNTIALYARFAFEVPAGKNYSTLTLRVKYDDGFIAYLNGTEVARANAPAEAEYNTPASGYHDDSQALVFQEYDLSPFLSHVMTGSNVLAVHALNTSSSSDFLILPELAAGLPDVVTNVAITEFMALNDATLKNSLGKYEDWIELYNPFLTNVNLCGWYLTDKATSPTKWRFPDSPASVIASKGYLLVWADSKSYSVTNNELHASFSLSGGGEYLALVQPDGVSVAYAYAPSFPAQSDDVSYGIGLTGENRFFAVPTPRAANAFAGGSNEVAGVKLNPKRGVFTSAVPQVTVTTATSGAEIRYTLDAEAPTPASPLYTAPFALAHTAVLRAAAFRNGFAPSAVDTHSYIALNDVLSQPVAPVGFPSDWTVTENGKVTNIIADYAMNPAIVSTSGAALTHALTVLPTLSLVTPLANLFDPETGIYVNAQETGDAWEREASAEWIGADNASRFQIDCGLRIQGAYFRQFLIGSKKKSFTLRFRSVYGEGRLKEELFSGSAVQSFNDLVLRAGACDAWNMWGQEKTQYIVDEFMRRTHLAMGGVAPHGTFVQLYLNGLYWGLYNVTEKVSGEFAAAYCGGREDTWDVLNRNREALEGDFVAWDAMMAALSAEQGSNAAYQRAQGNQPDGTRNPAYPVYLDVGDYIDYMIAEYWSANDDWPQNNWRAFRDRNDSASKGFKFALWDAEFGLGIHGDLATDQTGSAAGVAEIQSKLAANAEYRLRFADRVQKHLFNGGELTPAVAVPRYRELAALIEPALVAESARWGDQDGNASHTVEQWRVRRDYVLNTFLTQRGAMVLQHFRNRGLYPAVEAPAFACFGGIFTNSLNLGVTAAQPVYYTTDGSDPRQYGTGAAKGTLYTNGVPLTRTTRVKARARTSGGEWSALAEAVFTLAEKPALRVTELMFHPRRPVSVSGEGYLEGDDEFIELQNAGSVAIGLSGLHFTQGVSFDFTESAVQALNPGEYVLVVKNVAAFTNRYPAVPSQRIAGAFAFPSTSLDNAGEALKLEDALGRSIVSFTYNNRWLVAADGAGHSLVPLTGVTQADGELDYPGNWRASAYIGGSPGEAEPERPALPLVLNEVLAHTDSASSPEGSNDGIELYNTTDAPVVLGEGWYLSDDPEDLVKWAIPATNMLAARGWRYFDEIHDFHMTDTNGFGLNKAGEQVLLSYLPDGGSGRVVDAVRFRGEENGVPLVRYPDGAESWFYGQATPGASNRLADAGVVIAEVMYHPRPTQAHPANNENDEFVELYNPTEQPVTLENIGEDAGVWRLAGGIGYRFPLSTALSAGGRLAVVPFDPMTNVAAREAFLAAYGLTNGQIRMLGPYSGQLNNKTDCVRLERPVDPDAVGEDVSWHAVDQVTYSDVTPWPAEADGTGRPLARLPGRNSGDAAASWTPGLVATPGRAPVKVAVTAPAGNTGYLAPAAVTVAVSVDSAFIVGEVRQVVFAVDGLGAASVSAPPYAASVTLDAREGTRLLTARLTDDEGEVDSEAVPVMVYTNVPAFTATANRTVNLTVTNRVGLHAAVELLSGMTNEVSFAWSCPGDSSVVVENPTRTDAAARFTRLGVYELMLTMAYGQYVTNCVVTVNVTEVNSPNCVPYRESFETYELGSSLVGIGGWQGDSVEAAVVGTNRWPSAGPGGYPIAGAHERSLSFASGVNQRFERTGGVTNVCADMLLAFEAGDDEPPDVAPETQIAFWGDSRRRRVMVWHGQLGGTNRWTELPDWVLASNACVRLTVQADYGRTQQGVFGFRIWIDREPVTAPFDWFAAANTNRNYLSNIALSGAGQLDDLVVDAYNSMLYRRITAEAGPHGSVVPAGEIFVSVGGATNILLLPERFYGVGAVTVDGQSVGPASDYVFTNVWDEHTLSAEFLAKLTGAGVPEVWLNQLNPAWTNRFDEHEQADSDRDGAPNAQEYVAGTDAMNSQSVFRLDVKLSDGAAVVSFPTVQAGGVYGLGGVRRYALEQAGGLTADDWLGVSGLDAVAGWGQAVSYTNRLDAAPRRFFRGRVWLEP
jgi:hypothetical protein